jgi:hypothetical protein
MENERPETLYKLCIYKPYLSVKNASRVSFGSSESPCVIPTTSLSWVLFNYGVIEFHAFIPS